MDDARERFLRAIAERIPLERIAELHLFPPLRQGGRETGVAVVAAWPEEQFVQGELPPPVGLPQGEAEGAAPHPGDAGDIGEAPAADAGDIGETPAADTIVRPPEGDGVEVPPAAAAIPAVPEGDAVAPPPEGEATEEFWEAEEPDAPEGGDEGARPHAPPVRLIVYRAGYRWTLKGVDRGKWEVDIRAEADAPLEAVADVVRGVHRRAGGEAEPERLSGDAVRVALSDRPWAATT